MIVQYRIFFHADNRAGAGAYIDMSHVALIPYILHIEKSFAEFL